MEFLKNKNILIISPENWGKCRVSKHHYASHLANQGNRVYFLAKNQIDFSSPESGITLLTMPEIPPGMRFLPAFIRRIIHKKLGDKIRKKAGVTFEIIWSFDTSVLYDLESAFPESYRILHVVDLSMTFQWRIAAKAAHLCLGSSKIIVARLKQINPNSHFIHHGLAVYPTIKHTFTEKQNVVYAGNLNIKYLDRPRLERLIRTYPDVTFHFIGDSGADNLSDRSDANYTHTLSQFPNCKLYGAMTPEVLRSYMLCSDVLLLCYNPVFKDQISNPHKVMEYLSTGKPILSTVLDEYRDTGDLITMVDDEKIYVQTLSGLLSEKEENKAKERGNFAINNSYDKQIGRINELIAIIK